MIPNIVPPIDREYTLRYLRGNTYITNDVASEWQIMKGMLEEFFIPAARDPSFKARTNSWMADQSSYPWDTSPMKVIDNLLIGSRK